MTSFLCSLAPRTALAVGFLYPHRLPSLSNCRFPVYSNLAKSIVYEISKHRKPQYWVDRKLIYMAVWEEIYLSPFQRQWNRTTVHMSHFIIKCISNNLSNMTNIEVRGHASTNLCTCCGLVRERIQQMYQHSHEGSRGRWTASVDTLRKWLETRHADPDIATLLTNALLYISGEVMNFHNVQI